MIARSILGFSVTLSALAVVSAQQAAPPANSSSKATAVPATLDAFYKSLPSATPVTFDLEQATWLATMPLACLDHPQAKPAARPYLWEGTYTPVQNFDKTRAFYGCFDWHSSVNSTWALVKVIKTFPAFPLQALIRQRLDAHLGKSNIEGEVAYFKDAGQFELPYGYAWILKLQGELLDWKDPDAQKWSANLAPLAALMSERMVQYFKDTPRPNRTGVHPNTALAMHLMLDYTDLAKDATLRAALEEAATRFFGDDKSCKTAAEPGASDFLSPCLAEATIMSQLRTPAAYLTWLDAFLPPLQSADFKPLAEPSDPDLMAHPERLATKSHVIGLAFMRAEAMNRIASVLPPGDLRAQTLRRLSAMHAEMGLRAEEAAGYFGSHFLGAFTIFYMLSVTP
jgi:hypothetical protein